MAEKFPYTEFFILVRKALPILGEYKQKLETIKALAVWLFPPYDQIHHELDWLIKQNNPSFNSHTGFKIVLHGLEYWLLEMQDYEQNKSSELEATISQQCSVSSFHNYWNTQWNTVETCEG